MTEPHRVGDLQIPEDVRFQEREWTAERIGWVVLAILVLLALAGLFGTGPLSSASVDDADGALTAGYERFVRHDGRTTLSIEVAGDLSSNGEIDVWLSRDYLDAFEIQTISPEPSDVISADDRVIYVFPVDDSISTLSVSFSLRPQEMGRISCDAGVRDGPSVSFDQISFP